MKSCKFGVLFQPSRRADKSLILTMPSRLTSPGTATIGVGVGDAVSLGVAVGAGVGVGVTSGVGVGLLRRGVGVMVGIALGLAVGVWVGVAVGVAMTPQVAEAVAGVHAVSFVRMMRSTMTPGSLPVKIIWCEPVPRLTL